tara:strand:+ start:174149 stop:174925 length:777 start_codon:yes stop_codon:yes gene_type:complete
MKDKRTKVSGVIITFNEERNIARCLQSLQGLCDEIVVIDSYSTDQTKKICQSFNVKFIEHAFSGHIEQKNFALSQTKYDLVLSLDADEALSPKLSESIKFALENWDNEAFVFNRFTNYAGTWIKHSGWYPDAKLRLWDKRNGVWGGTNPHDSVQLSKAVSIKYLKGDLFHYSYYSIEEHIIKATRYTKIAAIAMNKQGKKSSVTKMILSSSFRFVRDYFFRLGFLDGFYGLIICATASYTTFLRYAYLKRLNTGKNID